MQYQLLTVDNKVLYEGTSDEPFEELHKFKRKTFGDIFDTTFRKSELREYLKHLCNHGGEIKLKIL